MSARYEYADLAIGVVTILERAGLRGRVADDAMKELLAALGIRKAGKPRQRALRHVLRHEKERAKATKLKAVA